MNQTFAQLSERLDQAMALKTALTLFEWDNETEAPVQTAQQTARVIGILSGEYLKAITDPQIRSLAHQLEQEKDLDDTQKGILRILKKQLDQLEAIPRQEYEDNARLIAQAGSLWMKARTQDDYQIFKPVLAQIIQYQKKFASYQAKEGEKLYDRMLETYEEGFSMEVLDDFFGHLKKELVPLLRKVMSRKQPEAGFLQGDYPQVQQQKLARFMAEYLGFDFERGVLAVSAHPFTTNLHNHDVRITTHYTSRMDSSLFSVIHETGHALYEFGIQDCLSQTLAGEGTSMGMHESQSRFFENIIGRSKAFWKPIYGQVQQMFPQMLQSVSLEEFVRGINRVQPGLIRIDADELTYSLHILIRYEIEKMLMEENLDLDLLPQVWADKYEEYLGLRPQCLAEGVLQDIHWSQGSFGYFPSYALGNAFGVQIYAHMRKIMDFDGLLEQGRIDVIREYLREHIHQYGRLKNSRQILRDITGEDFQPAYYTEYLKEKYGRCFSA